MSLSCLKNMRFPKLHKWLLPIGCYCNTIEKFIVHNWTKLIGFFYETCFYFIILRKLNYGFCAKTLSPSTLLKASLTLIKWHDTRPVFCFRDVYIFCRNFIVQIKSRDKEETVPMDCNVLHGIDLLFFSEKPYNKTACMSPVG